MSHLYTFLGRVALALVTQAVPAQADSILFDQGHGQRFVIERNGELDLSSWAELFKAQGVEVVSSQAPLDQLNLDAYTALIISGAFKPFSSAERRHLLQYVEQGGSVVILLHVGPLNGELLADLGVGVSNGVIFDPAQRIGESSSDFSVVLTESHPLLHGIEQLKVYGIWALNPGTHAQSLFNASPAAWMDLNRNRQQDSAEPVAPFSLAVTGFRGLGRFVVIGDDAVFQNRFLVDENRQLASNLVDWLHTHQREH